MAQQNVEQLLQSRTALTKEADKIIINKPWHTYIHEKKKFAHFKIWGLLK